MGTWSAQPCGNDTACEWVWALESSNDWNEVRRALTACITGTAAVGLDYDTAAVGVAGAEVVAHGLGRPTQTEGDGVDEVRAFLERAGNPPADLRILALAALTAAEAPASELAELWAEGPEDPGWRASAAALRAALIRG